ncbi:MAG: hypothetical protein H0T84_04580 [Tatlockia sp.]|nr:hypothetical protein [Tatlockia sp.]
MKKRLICVALMVISAATYALTADEKADQEIENMKILEKMGLPLPGSGIKVVPRSMMNLSPEEIQQGDKEMAEFKEKGYVNKYINRPHELLSMNESLVKKELMKSEGRKNPTSTGLSRDVNQIKLAFKFPVKTQMLAASSQDIKMLAAAPKGGFHEDKGGWSGVSQFFIYKNIGTCSYSVMNVKASNTAALLAQEDVTYTINNKATILMPVEGSENSGYIYYVKWYDDVNFHELECANMHYSTKTNEAVISLAQNLDNHG